MNERDEARGWVDEDAPLDGGRGPIAAVARARGLTVSLRRRLGAPTDFRLRIEAAGRGLLDALRGDLEAGLAAPLVVVVFACGCALYFVLPREPWLPATMAAAFVAVAAAWFRRRRGKAARGGVIVAALALGVAVAGVGTARMASPRLDRERTVEVEGRVVDLDATAKGGTRLGVEVTRMVAPGLGAAATPSAITATLSLRGWVPKFGEGVAFKARLKPPEGPVLPGGYDFARRAFFEGYGATGYVLGRAQPLDLGPPSGLQAWFSAVGDLRHMIGDRVRATLPGATGTIAAAIMVGEQRAIPESAGEPLRSSGLTHIVSISGLHMSLVAGGVIAAIRFGLALFPALALRISTKKWAAAAAMVAATVYLLLSGNQVAALRSHLMLMVALLAVLVDRPAITMHTVAVSAALILVWEPWSVLEPSFLMSYLAVIALVASYDLWRIVQERRPPPEREAALPVRAVWAGLRHVEGLAFSSLIAGLATAPVIAGVFYRGAPYSILANMIVLPVTGLLIMPAAVVAALAMPFGLDPLPLWAMGLGVDFMVAVGRWVSQFPGGAGLIGAPHPLAMPLGVGAVLWLSLWRSRARLLGLAPGVLALALVAFGPRPDVLVGRHGSPVAVRGGDGRLHVLAGRQDRFDVANWLAADADPRPADAASLAEGWRCDGDGCLFRLPGPAPTGEAPAASAAGEDFVVAVVRRRTAFDEDCRRAGLVVSTLVAPPGCRDRTEVVDRATVARSGAASLIFGSVIAPPLPTTARSAPVDPTAGRMEMSVGDEPAQSAAEATEAGADGAGTGALAVEAPADRGRTGALAAGEASVDPDSAFDFDPSGPRRVVRLRASLPYPARPWTPVDPLAAKYEAEAAIGRGDAGERSEDVERAPETGEGATDVGPRRTVVRPRDAPVDPTDPPSGDVSP